MKWINFALASCVSLLAMTAHAQADFIITPIAFALFAGPLGAVASFGAIYTGIQIAAYAAVLGAQLAFSNRSQQKLDPGEMKNTFQESETSEFNAVGRVKLGGLKAFGNTKGNVISRLIWHVKGPMVAIEQYFLGGREVTVEADGAVSSPPWARSGGSWAYLHSKIGDGSETSWAQLISYFPDLWTSAHRCKGIFQSLVQFVIPDFSTEAGNKKFQKLYQGGAPDAEVVARVGRIYDPRQPGQDANTPSTWTWSDNGILVAVHIMRSYPDLKASDFDWAFLALEANLADTLVATKTGTEKRCRSWGIWPSESRRGDTMQQVLDSIGAEVVLNDTGLIRIRLIDDAPASELLLPALHTTELSWKSGPEAVERPNICRIKYYSPERGYDMGEINMAGIAWARIDEEVARYGEKTFDVELPFCPSASQAQRIARRIFLQARADAGSIRTNMVGLAAWGVTYATIEDSDAEEGMLCRLASPRVDDEQGTVEIPYIVWPHALIDEPWNPAVHEAAAPEQIPEIGYDTALATPAMPTQATVVQYPGGAYETRLKYSGVGGGSYSEAVLRTYTAGDPNPFSSMSEHQGGGSWFAYAPGSTLGTKVDFKTRFFNNEDEGSNFSPLLSVDPMATDNTACGMPTAASVEVVGGIEFTVTVSELRAACIERRIYITNNPFGGGSWGPWGNKINVRPYSAVTFTTPPPPMGQSIDVEIRTLTSDATPGPAASLHFNGPSDPGED